MLTSIRIHRFTWSTLVQQGRCIVRISCLPQVERPKSTRLRLTIRIPVKSLVHQYGDSIGILPSRESSAVAVTWGKILPGTRNLQWHSNCHIPHPEGEIQSGKGRTREEAYIWRVANDNIWLGAGVVCGGSPLSSEVLIAARCTSSIRLRRQFWKGVPSVVPRAKIVWSRVGSHWCCLGKYPPPFSPTHSAIPNEDASVEFIGNRSWISQSRGGKIRGSFV